MAELEEILLTKDGYYELQERLEYLKTTARREVAEKIKVAREFGDLSENAEYEEAKNEQGFIEGEIVEIEYKLKNAKIIDNKKTPKGVVAVGSSVKIYDPELDEEMEYRIVGSDEVDLDNKLLSNQSPVGQALVGSKVGDKVTVHAPGGDFVLEIRSVK
ncbi:MAG: transcription elongation factor GreA [Eubacteriaceae bacterium]|nr:transcription elongation factor GreA [Eubacteriaceae bacterium]MBR5995699.1 transcription elongation factor GreA [Eubacteriaceae bacterium]